MRQDLPRAAATDGKIHSSTQRIVDWLVAWALPVGWMVLLSGMFWLGSRKLYSQAFYTLLAFPTVLILIRHPRLIASVLDNPLVRAYLVFAAYVILSIGWSGSDSRIGSLLEPPLYVFLLFCAALIMAAHAPQRLERSVAIAAWTATCAALVSLSGYFFQGADVRFEGYGALFNPLLTSHVFGFFLTLWIAHWVVLGRIVAPASLASILIIGLLILTTGSRTPLVAIGAVLAWLGAARGNRRSIATLATLALLGLVVLLANFDQVSARGLSYRPDIWAEAWRQIAERPWLGHGYDHPLEIRIPGVVQGFADPHNIELAVLYYGGIVGLALWTLLYGIAFVLSWRHRSDKRMLIASALLVFGVAAGMTEGGAFLARPKEHWFLIWIPLASVAAVFAALRQRDTPSRQRD